MFMRFYLSEMENLDVAPLLFQVLGYKPSMAPVGAYPRCTARHPSATIVFRNGFLNLPLTHKRVKAYLIGLPNRNAAFL